MITKLAKADLALSLECLTDSIQDLQTEIAQAEVDGLMDDAVEIEQAIKRLRSRVAGLEAE